MTWYWLTGVVLELCTEHEYCSSLLTSRVTHKLDMHKLNKINLNLNNETICVGITTAATYLQQLQHYCADEILLTEQNIQTCQILSTTYTAIHTTRRPQNHYGLLTHTHRETDRHSCRKQYQLPLSRLVKASTFVILSTAVVKIDCSKRLAFLLYDFKLISNQQQLISKTDTYVQSM